VRGAKEGGLHIVLLAEGLELLLEPLRVLLMCHRVVRIHIIPAPFAASITRVWRIPIDIFFIPLLFPGEAARRQHHKQQR
jgi:hypothetical protein